MIPVALFSTPNCKYAYDANVNDFIPLSEESYRLMKSEIVKGGNLEEPNEELKLYQDMGFFRKSAVEEINHPYTEILETLINRKMSHITLQLTQNCNLRCKYCVYSETNNLGGRTHTNKCMSWDVAKRAVDFLREHSIDSKKISIGFYGGEPLIQFELLKRVVAYAKDIFQGKEIDFGITTNATLLSEEIIDFMYENNVRIMISIDGPQIIHDANRKYVSGRGSYEDVIKNIRRIKDRYPEYFNRVSYSLVIDPNNDFDCINEITVSADGLSPESFFSAFVEKEEKVSAPKEYVEKHQYNKFLAILACFGRYDRAKVSALMNNEIVTLINDYELKDTRGTLVSIDAPNGPCAVGKNRPFIDVDGRIFPCERVGEASVSMMIGDIFAGIDIDRAKELLNVSKITSEQCKNCWSFKYCTQCAKHANAGEKKLSAEMRLAKCYEVKSSAYERLRQILLLHELETQYRKQVATIRRRDV